MGFLVPSGGGGGGGAILVQLFTGDKQRKGD